jgi:hypothetical protein
MTSKELQKKALEVAQLEWWLQNPELKSFLLCVERCQNDEGETVYQQSETKFHTGDKEEPWEQFYDWDYSYNCIRYPVAIDMKDFYARVKRPYQTDAEIQARIDVILKDV